MEIKFSIIIPVYNRAHTLNRALQSVLKQTYSNLEIICINDGSTDQSLEILKYYASLDKRIVVLEQSHLGVSKARNLGLEWSSGEWILFLDSDDELPLDIVEKYSKNTQCDFIVSSYTTCVDGRWKENPIKTSKIERKKIGEYILQNEEIQLFYYMCSKCFKNDIIKRHQLRFIESNYGEDSLFVFQYLKYIENIIALNTVGYHIYRTANSLSLTLDIDIRELIKTQEKIYFLSKDISLKGDIFLDIVYRKMLFIVINNMIKVQAPYSFFKKTIKELKELEHSSRYFELFSEGKTWRSRFFENKILKYFHEDRFIILYFYSLLKRIWGKVYLKVNNKSI